MVTNNQTPKKITKMRLLKWFQWSNQDRYPTAFVLFCFGLATIAGLAIGYEIAYVRWWSDFKAIAPQVVTVAGGAIAGVVALWQYNRSHQQRDIQFRKKELQDQFVDILDRLAAPEAIISANAALRLAEFGKTLPQKLNQVIFKPQRTTHIIFLPLPNSPRLYTLNLEQKCVRLY